MPTGAVVPPGWLQAVRIDRGREALVLTTPEDGTPLAPGQDLQLSLPACQGERLRFALRCEDGLDVGFCASQLRGAGTEDDATVLRPHAREIACEGECEVEVDGRCVLAFDNRHAWLSSKTVHATIERLGGARNLVGAGVSSCASQQADGFPTDGRGQCSVAVIGRGVSKG